MPRDPRSPRPGDGSSWPPPPGTDLSPARIRAELTPERRAELDAWREERLAELEDRAAKRAAERAAGVARLPSGVKIFYSPDLDEDPPEDYDAEVGGDPALPIVGDEAFKPRMHVVRDTPMFIAPLPEFARTASPEPLTPESIEPEMPADEAPKYLTAPEEFMDRIRENIDYGKPGEQTVANEFGCSRDRVRKRKAEEVERRAEERKAQREERAKLRPVR